MIPSLFEPAPVPAVPTCGAGPATLGAPAVDWDAFEPEGVEDALVAVVRATCLLESRSRLYGAYLERVLPDRLAPAIDAWAAEEEHHGRALRRWLMLADPTFDADAALRRFLLLPYHVDGGDDRGGPTHELVARCVVEALASGFYLALADRTREPLLRQICLRLSWDEHRHHHQFLAMMTMTPPLAPRRRMVAAVRRALEIEDGQVTSAAHLASRGDGRQPGEVGRRHFATVYGLYRIRHLDHVQTLVWEAVGRVPPSCGRRALSRALFLALAARRVTLAIAGTVAP